MSKDCRSFHHCQNCQKSHDALLHVDTLDNAHSSTVSSNAATGVIPDTLLITFQALVNTQDGSTVKVHGLLIQLPLHHLYLSVTLKFLIYLDSIIRLLFQELLGYQIIPR